MKKIPVGATVSHAYRFAVGNIVPIAALIWAPFVVQMALATFMLQRFADFLAASLARDPSALSQLMPFILLYPFTGILTFVQFTAVSEYALGMRQATAFSFPLGKPVWRLIGACLLFLAAFVFIVIVFALGGFLLGFLLELGIKAASPATANILVGLLSSLVVLTGYCGFFYFTLRLGFLLAPVTLVLQRVDLYEGWRLCKGNFWRIFAIFLAVIVPVAILEYSLIIAAVGLPPTLPGGTSQEALQALEHAKLAWNLALFSAMATYWYITYPVTALLAVFMYGAGCASQAFAYRALTQEDASVPVASD